MAQPNQPQGQPQSTAETRRYVTKHWVNREPPGSLVRLSAADAALFKASDSIRDFDPERDGKLQS